MRRKLKCHKFDFTELNTADFRGIDEVRKIRVRIQSAPLKGKCRVWLIDECHKLTSDAQHALLKMLEDTPNHIYFFLATTNPEKLLKTIRNRCTEISVKPLKDKDLIELIKSVCIKEGLTGFPSDVVKKIVECSEGSARKALVFLHKVIELKNKKEMLNAIITASAETQAFEIVRALLYKPKTTWSQMAKILRETMGEDAEQIRWLVLACAKTEILKGGKLAAKAFLIIDAFRDNFYDSKHAGLCAACYEVIVGSG